jgi:uncharacterized protein
VRFWDSSAIAPLLVSEPFSSQMEELVREDDEIVVWWGSRVECTSAVRRREREGVLDSGDVRAALELLETLDDAWAEVVATDSVRAAAERSLALHPLRAADALQLAAALIWKGDAADRYELVSLDERLRDSAAREGFAVLPRSLG